MTSEQALGLLDMVNIRDLGGLPTVDGGETRRHLLYRSESLSSVSKRDGEALVGPLRIRNVIDLRAALEVDYQQATWAKARGVDYQNLPLSDGFDDLPATMTPEALAELLPVKYLSYLDRAPSNIVRALVSVTEAASDGRASLFACTYGKDRTGVLAMVLLDLLRVRRSNIVDDYVASAAAMPELLVRMKDHALHGPRILAVPAEVYQAKHDTAKAFLRGLDERGGAQAWAEAAGFARSSLDQARTCLVARFATSGERQA